MNQFIGGFKMSYTQLIKDTLNILDLTIYFEENCLTKERYKGQICLIYKGTLQYTPEECPHCLCVVPSKIIRWPVVTRLKENTSMTEIARQKNISTSSVYRVMKRFYRPLNPFKHTLPKILCFDEFKSVRGVASAMIFIMMDGQRHELLDIVENRRLPYLGRYFFRVSLATRKTVEFIVIDRYAPYVSLVKKLFPNA